MEEGGGPHARADEDASRSLEFQGRGAGSPGASSARPRRPVRSPTGQLGPARLEDGAAAGRWGPGRLTSQPAMHMMQSPLGLAQGPDPLVWTELGGPIDPPGFWPAGRRCEWTPPGGTTTASWDPSWEGGFLGCADNNLKSAQ